MGFDVGLEKEVALVDIVVKTLLDYGCMECLRFVHERVRLRFMS